MRVALILLASAGLIYGYVKYVRPLAHDHPLFRETYARADGFYAKVCLWLRRYWDIAGAAGIWAATELPGLAAELLADGGADLDLSGLIPSDTTNGTLKVLGVALPIVRMLALRWAARKRAESGE